MSVIRRNRRSWLAAAMMTILIVSGLGLGFATPSQADWACSNCSYVCMYAGQCYSVGSIIGISGSRYCIRCIGGGTGCGYWSGFVCG